MKIGPFGLTIFGRPSRAALIPCRRGRVACRSNQWTSRNSGPRNGRPGLEGINSIRRSPALEPGPRRGDARPGASLTARGRGGPIGRHRASISRCDATLLDTSRPSDFSRIWWATEAEKARVIANQMHPYRPKPNIRVMGRKVTENPDYTSVTSNSTSAGDFAFRFGDTKSP